MPGVPAPNLGLKKAKLVVVGGGGELEFQFNPTKYTLSRSASWSHTQTASQQNDSVQYTGDAEPPSLKIDDILFDAYEKLTGDVSPKVKQLLDWVKPTQRSENDDRPVPVILEFQYGGNAVLADFKGYLASVDATYTMFNKGGKPIRARCNILLKASKKTAPAPTNPTSGSLEARRSRMLIEGDSLQSLAYAEYGVPAFWRGLAAFNGIEDPLRVRPGTRVLIPTPEEVASLS